MMMFCCCRWSKKRCLVLLLAVIVIFCVLVLDTAHQTRDRLVECSDTHSRKLLVDICNKYTAGYVTGSICHPLCKSNKITYSKCLGHKVTDLVFLAWWEDVANIILKVEVSLSSTIKFHFEELNEDQMSFPYRPVTEFKKLLRLGFNVSDNVVNRILMECDAGQDGLLTNREALYCWHMLDKDEVLLSLELDSFQVVPRLYGTCGNLMAFEYVPGQPFNYPIVTDGRGWDFRAKLAVSLLELVERLDDIKKNNYLLCDSQESNFGVIQSRGGHYIAMSIDNDLTVSELSLQKTVNYERNNSCSNNEDCAFIDCKVSCDTNRGKCSGIILSNNLQIICKTFFVPKIKTLLGNTLLHDPPQSISRELQSLIEECVNPITSSTKISRDLARRFKRLLSTSRVSD